ncbi:potassium channel family protein [Halomonas sp. M20]|uniref:potassium channel family protein n=1 Tax=Halomonas sp. M20 TaxID=2763264 RepID=UPI001D0A17FA|nr:potassium channel family protein [Halomonas sp. M20]
MIGNHLLGIIGFILIALATYDAIQTTLSASNSGPLTNRFINCIGEIFLTIHRRRKSHAMLNALGPWITVLLIILWVSLAWLGWFLLFCSVPYAVVNSTTMMMATALERFYFIGYTISTLGYGDYVPGDNFWRFLSALAAANGLFLFTLAVTYIVPVVSATVQKRQCALSISALGHSPLHIIKTTHHGESFPGLANQLVSLQGSITTLGQQHLAYPILHYYHSRHSISALPVALARLYQALLIIEYACPRLDPATRLQISLTLDSIHQFLDTLHTAFIYPSQHEPSLPDLLPYAELPCFDKTAEKIHDHLSSQSRQKLLLCYNYKDGWDWEDVWNSKDT